ncbi:MAG: Ig-like domain-containing protein, partial [Thermoanaerobaculia bacterium]
CPNTAGWGQIDINSPDFDRGDMRQFLRRIIETGMSVRRWLDDPILTTETWLGQPLSTNFGHFDHLHVRIRPSLVPSGARGTASLLFPGLSGAEKNGAGMLRVYVQGAGNDDVPVDAEIRMELGEPFDPTTLNASTVELAGPLGGVQGDVLVASGQDVSFRPVTPLEFGTAYTLTVNTGAVLADGSLLAEPLSETFTTEATTSLRVLGTWPAEMSEQVPIDIHVHVSFDGPVDPRTLAAGGLTLRDERQGIEVPVAMSLVERRTILVLVPLAPLAELSFHTLSISDTVRGLDGSPLVATPRIASFFTSLRPGLERIEIEPDQIAISRADLSERSLAVTGFFADGSISDLTSPGGGGTDYGVDKPLLVRVDAEGIIVPLDDGTALLDVVPLLDGFRKTVRVDVVDVFPEITFRGRQFDLGVDEPVVIGSSEPLDSAVLGIANVQVTDLDSNVVAGSVSLALDGLTFSFEPFQPLLARTDYRITFDLVITDDLGVTRPFPRRFPFATAAANLGFELGDLEGFETEGDVEVVASFGPLAAPEGSFMAKLINSDLAVGGQLSKLSTIDLAIPEESSRLELTYNFLTDEIEQGNPFNDFFRAILVLPDGSAQTIVQVTRDNLRFSGQSSPVAGFDRMTGFRTAGIGVGALATGQCQLILEVAVSDVGDTSIDSAVLIDDIHFE